MIVDNKKMSNYLLYSNKNIEKMISNIVAESSNAALVSMYDDKVILVDHTNGNMYTADYNFDGKVVTMENFEPITFEKSDSKLLEAINEYLDDEDGTATTNLVETYEDEAENRNNDELKDAIVEALSAKNMENVIDYSELKGVNEDVKDFLSTPLAEAYKERIDSHPTSSIKFFDFEKPVKVAIIDEDENKVLTKDIKKKALDLLKDKSFKEDLAEALKEFMDDNSTENLNEVVSNNPSVLVLDEAELKELVGLSVIGEKELMENRSNLVKAIMETVDNDETLHEKAELLKEAEDETDDKEEGDKEDKAPEADEKSLDDLEKALDKAMEKCGDNEALCNKIQALKDAIEDSKKT